MTVLAGPPWTSVLPFDATFTCGAAPEWFRELLRAKNGDGPSRALVIWGAGRADLDAARDHSALVLVRPRSVSDAELRTMGFGWIRRFAVLPTIGRPSPDLTFDKRDVSARWFLPLDSSAIGLGAFRALYAPYRRTTRARAFAVRAVLAAGLGRHAFDHLCIAQRSAPPLETRLEELLGVPVRLGLTATGWGRRTTTTVAVLDRRGRAMAFAKFPLTGLAERMVRHEARVLSRLPAGTRAPQLLFEGDLDSTYVAVQSALEGAPAPARLTPSHARFLDGLRTTTRRPAAESSFLRSLDARIRALGTRADLRAALSSVCSELGPAILPRTVTHGDVIPANLRVAGGEIGAFDWEDATPDGLPLIDLFHHEVHVGLHHRRWTVERTADRLRAIASRHAPQLGPGPAHALLRAYLLDAYARRLEGGDGNGPVARRYNELLRIASASPSGSSRSRSR